MEVEEVFRARDGEEAQVDEEMYEDDFIFPQWYDKEFGEIMSKQYFSATYQQEVFKQLKEKNSIVEDNLKTIQNHQETQI